MGVRRPPVSRADGRAVWRAVLCFGALVLAVTAHARGVDAAWWAELPRFDPAARPLADPHWYDVLDVAVGVTGSTQIGAITADLSLRARLDARAYLDRVASERADLAAMDDAFARQRAMHEQLEWVAQRCEGMWRAWQVRLLDAALERPSEAAEDAAYLAALRRRLALDASRLATPPDVAACRLPGVLDGLALAHDHPTLVLDAASRSLRERTERVMAAPSPATAWVTLDLEAGSAGRRADVRVGLDLPVPVRTGAVDIQLSGDAQGVRGRVAWQRSGVAAGSLSHQRVTTDASRDDTQERLVDTLLRRGIEAGLLRSDADRLWAASCGAAAPTDVLACMRLASDRADTHLEPSVASALMSAIDAEVRALSAVLGTIEASGHVLEALVLGR